MKRRDSKYQEIVQRALLMANSVGMEAVTLGNLAKEIGMSKSGLFAHFKSKEALQLAVIELSASHFTNVVVKPALQQPQGWPRLTALFENYLCWLTSEQQQGTCFFVAASQEFDDQPGVLRDVLYEEMDNWRLCIARIAAPAISAQAQAEGANAELLAFEFIGLTMSFQLAYKMLSDEQAEIMLRQAFALLLQRYGITPPISQTH